MKFSKEGRKWNLGKNWGGGQYDQNTLCAFLKELIMFFKAKKLINKKNHTHKTSVSIYSQISM